MSVAEKQILLAVGFKRRAAGENTAEVMSMTGEAFPADTPAGFRNTMIANRQAMDAYLALSASQRRELIEGARQVRSKAEMKNYVNQVGGVKPPHGPVQL